MGYLNLLLAGLTRKKTRTLLTLFSVIAAFLLFGLLQAVKIAFDSGVEAADAKRLLTTARYSIIDPLPIAHLGPIEKTDGVLAVTYANWFGGKYQDQSNAFPVFAVDQASYLNLYPEFTIRPDQREAWMKTRTGAIAGQRLVDRYGWKLGQKLPIHSEIFAKSDGSLDWEFDLVGIIDTLDLAQAGNTDMVLIGHTYFDESRRLGKGSTGWYIIRIADAKRAREISEAIDARFRNSPDETKTQPEKEFAMGFAKQIGDIGALVTRILAAVFFTLLFLTGNALAQSIRERIPEFAILKTLGFKDTQVAALVLAEAILLLALGAAMGLGLASAMMGPLNAKTGGKFPPLFVGVETWGLGLLVVVVLGLMIGLPPAWKVRRLRIVEALQGH